MQLSGRNDRSHRTDHHIDALEQSDAGDARRVVGSLLGGLSSGVLLARKVSGPSVLTWAGAQFSFASAARRCWSSSSSNTCLCRIA